MKNSNLTSIIFMIIIVFIVIAIALPGQATDSLYISSNGYVGVGTSDPGNNHMYITNSALNTADTFKGLSIYEQKTSGASNYDDTFHGIYSLLQLNQSGGETGTFLGLSATALLSSGTIGNATSGTKNMHGGFFRTQITGGKVTGNTYGIYQISDLDGGTASGNVTGLSANVDIESAATVGGNVYGSIISVDCDSAPSGTVYGLFIDIGTNVDYGLYVQSGAKNYLGQSVSIGTTSLVGSEKLRVNGQIYADGNMSAASFTDRTPYYEGDALSELLKISGKNGELDHTTLPKFVKKTIPVNIYEDVALNEITDTTNNDNTANNQIGKTLNNEVYKDVITGKTYQKAGEGEIFIKDGIIHQRNLIGTETEEQRDLGAMISMLTVAIQQQQKEIEELKALLKTAK